jgi:predicted DNA-binding protein with PD1-like motif
MCKSHALRLKPGDDLKKEIDSFIQLHHIEAGWIGCCVGSLTEYHIRFANQTSGSHGLGHFEIVSLTGTVSVNGCHLHISISDETGRTIGGHLLGGNTIYTTAELVIIYTDEYIFDRVKDATTPWKELVIRKSGDATSRKP